MNKPHNTFPENELRLFTRYPKPGQAKTRLIPEIGKQAAADLQRRMTEQITSRMSELNPSRFRLTISFSDSSEQDMRQWLGSGNRELNFALQSGDHLGDRMKNDFLQSFRDGHDQTVIIGTDCPGITKDIVKKAFSLLQTHDIVLGPAKDGGYYLIGLSTMEKQLFSNIDWGTDAVFDQTMTKVHQNELRVETLDPLRDIDRPDDLQYLEDIDCPE